MTTLAHKRGHSLYLELVVEQSHAGEGHGDAAVVALLDDQIVTDGAAGLGDVLVSYTFHILQ